MANENQRELIETEMARLIGELQQLKGVREALTTQTERKTVGDYLLTDDIRGRYFISDSAREHENYRVLELKTEKQYGSGVLARIKFVSGATTLKHLEQMLNDLEAPLESEPQQ
jgi:hypothetical protein